MTEKLLFITDSMKGLKPKKDTSIFMMEESISMGYKVFQCEMKDLFIEGGIVHANCRSIIEVGEHQVEGIAKESLQVSEFTYSFMRKDPPVDSDYINALHLLGLAEKQGATVFNKPNSIKEFNEKYPSLESSRGYCPVPDNSYKQEASKNFTVAIGYNKGGYQVIPNSEIKDIGK